jgi:hypothetical protein
LFGVTFTLTVTVKINHFNGITFLTIQLAMKTGKVLKHKCFCMNCRSDFINLIYFKYFIDIVYFITIDDTQVTNVPQ